MKTYSSGFLGTVTTECLEYACAQLKSAESIMLPFTGSGKNVAALALESRVIYSWDTQEATRLLVGVLQNPFEINLTEPKGMQGWAKSEHPFSGLDEGTARLINYIAKKGTVHERAALVKVIIGSTLMGRLGAWGYSNEGYEHFWGKFIRAREKLEGWSNLPGHILHMKEDYFTLSDRGEVDGLYLDPPKVIGRTDVYSGKAYTNLNSVLEQRDVELPVWKIEGYYERIQRVLTSVKWKRALVFYSSGLVPTLEGLLHQPIIDQYTSIESFDHGESRCDFVITIDA